MPDYFVQGPELKKLVKVARKQPLPFAFNPGKSDAEHVMAMHRKFPVGVLSKAARKDGPGKKVAAGMCEVKEKVLELTCESTVPALAKILKRYLKANKIRLNVRILDMDGNLIEEDIEDLPDDPEFDEPVADAAPAPEPEPEPSAPGPDRTALIARVKAAQTGIAGAPGPVAEKLTPALRAVVGQINADDLDGADRALTQIEAVLAKLAARPAEPAPAPAAPAPDTTASSEATDTAQAIRELAQMAQALEDPARAKIMASLKQLGDLLKSGQIDKAAAGVPRVRQAIDMLLAQKATAPETAPELDPRIAPLQTRIAEAEARLPDLGPAADRIAQALSTVKSQLEAGNVDATEAALPRIEAALDQLQPAPAQEDDSQEAKWLEAYEALKPDADAALDAHQFADEGEEDTFKARLKYAEASAAEGQFEAALNTIPGLRAMLDAAAGNAPGSSAPKIADDVQPFAISRIKWAETRMRMKDELAKLQDAIAAACQADEDLQDLAGEVGTLTGYLAKLDDRLEDKLDNVVQAPPGDQRDACKTEALAMVTEYQAELQSDFFQDVDSNNGFVDIAVASTAVSALDEIAAVLR